MSQQQLLRSAAFLEDGATASCFISFVCLRQRSRASWLSAFWEKPYLEVRTPPAFAITHSRHHFVCVHEGHPL